MMMDYYNKNYYNLFLNLLRPAGLKASRHVFPRIPIFRQVESIWLEAPWFFLPQKRLKWWKTVC